MRRDPRPFKFGTCQTAVDPAGAGELAVTAGRDASPRPRCRAAQTAGGSNKTVRVDKAKYYILIDLIFVSQWNSQRYLTRITRVLSGDGNTGKVPFGWQTTPDLELH